MIPDNLDFLSISQRRSLSDFIDYINTEEGAKLVSILRKGMGYPDAGFEYTEQDKELFETDDRSKLVERFLYKPGKMRSIKKNGYTDIPDTGKRNEIVFNLFNQKYNSEDYFNNLMYAYVYFNKIIPEVGKIIHSDPRILFENIQETIEASRYNFALDKSKTTQEEQIAKYFHNLSRTYKYAFFISEDASQNEIINFVYKNWKAKKAKRLRTRRKTKRDEIIRKNIDKPSSEIVKIISKEIQENMDDTHINVIKRKFKKN